MGSSCASPRLLPMSSEDPDLPQFYHPIKMMVLAYLSFCVCCVSLYYLKAFIVFYGSSFLVKFTAFSVFLFVDLFLIKNVLKPFF